MAAHRRRRLIWSLVLIPAVVFSVAQVFAETPDLKIYLFSVGQTDAQLVVGPSKNLLIDTGAEVAGPKRQYEYVADKIRQVTGGAKIDYFLISHYHVDHMGNLYHNSDRGNGLWGLLDDQGITIETLIDRGDDTPFGPRTSSHSNYMLKVPSWINDNKVERRRTAVLGTNQIDLGGNVRAEVVAVNGDGVLQARNAENPDRFRDYPPSENDYSVALKISLGKFEYFTGGDLSGQDAERDFPGGTTVSYNDIETRVATKVGDVEVLRANHHGSGHSSNPYFVSHLDPELSVISCGTNTYHHPNKEVFRRLAETGRVLITTDVSRDEWPDDSEVRPHILGRDLLIQVYDGGNRYDVDGNSMTSFSDEEEASQVDARSSGSTVSPDLVIRWEEAPNYLNQQVTVEGTIIEVKKLATIAFLNFSPQYWRDLSGVIFGSDFSRFPADLEGTYENKTVRITGRITEYEGRPQMKLSEPSQISIIGP